MDSGPSKRISSGRRSGDENSPRFFDIFPPVFWPSAILALGFVGVTVAVGKPMEAVFADVQAWISDSFGWLFILAVNFFLLFLLFLAASPYGRLRLGGKDAVPDFSRTSWFAMLFSAGMGIGILFWSVAEPLYHYTEPPREAPDAIAAAEAAMEVTFLHWGLHAWAVYCLVGMALAFFAFNRREPLAIRSVFKPLLGKRVEGPVGHIIDVLAVMATLFGLATSLGFGVQQISSGLEHLLGLTITPPLQILLIAIVTLLATVSVASGIDSGIRQLSELNIRLGGLLLLFVFVLGPTVFVLESFLQNLGGYLDSFFAIAFWTESYAEGQWQDSWTVFYWSWWISWSPFVGMFIARISRGRTLREFILSVLVIPTLLTFFWISAFGGTAILYEMREVAATASEMKENVSLSLYFLLENFPLSGVSSSLAVLLVVSFFVTSADSGSLVVDSFASGGKLTTPVTQRIFWTVTLGAIASALLFGGGLGALQAAAISTGLPFALLLLVMSFSLYRGLQNELLLLDREERERERESYADLLGDIVRKQEKGDPADD
ncbi:MAG: BCCT family transporter [Verrucomicrobia bacterium]|nr:BCCT family transporter [Verrucomicrobiota bacterium]